MRVIIALALLACPAFSADTGDYLRNKGTEPVALQGGDTPATYSVVCSIDGATRIRPAVTDRSRRRVCFQNSSGVLVALGSSTVSASNLWRLGESTNTATSPIYCTNSSGAFYCSTLVDTISSSTVRVIEETQSVP